MYYCKEALTSLISSHLISSELNWTGLNKAPLQFLD